MQKWNQLWHMSDPVTTIEHLYRPAVTTSSNSGSRVYTAATLGLTSDSTQA